MMESSPPRPGSAHQAVTRTHAALSEAPTGHQAVTRTHAALSSEVPTGHQVVNGIHAALSEVPTGHQAVTRTHAALSEVPTGHQVVTRTHSLLSEVPTGHQAVTRTHAALSEVPTGHQGTNRTHAALSEVPTGHQVVTRTHAVLSEVPTRAGKADRSGNSPAGTHTARALAQGGHFLSSCPAIPVLPLPGREQGHDGSAARASCASGPAGPPVRWEGTKPQKVQGAAGLCLLSTLKKILEIKTHQFLPELLSFCAFPLNLCTQPCMILTVKLFFQLIFSLFQKL